MVPVQVKTMNGTKVVWDNVSPSETVQSLYERVDSVEQTPKGKWKLMLTSPAVRTMKWADKDKSLADFGIVTTDNDERIFKVEVVLDMGACHSSRR